MSDWKKDLRDRFEDFREQEPEGLWSAIEAEVAPTKKKVRPLFWAAIPAAAAVAALFLLPGRGVDTPASLPERSVAEAVPADTPAAADTVADLAEQLKALDERNVLADNPVPVVRKRSSVSVPQEVTSLSVPSADTGEEILSQKVTEAPGDEAVTPEETGTIEEARTSDNTVTPQEQEGRTPETAARMPEAVQPASPEWIPAGPERGRREWSGRVSVNLIHSSGAMSNTVSHGIGSGPAPAKRSAPAASDTRSLARLLTSNQPTVTEANHGMPIRIGLTISYNFAGNWSIETGAYHAALPSIFRSGTESVYTVTSQKLQCIGIPLHLRLQLTPADRLFSLYGVAGGSWEKGYSALRTSTSYISDREQSSDKESFRPEFAQWSADAALGLQFRFTGRSAVAVFAEPGVSYHFGNGSEIRTVYSDKPLSPSLTVGLRVLL